MERKKKFFKRFPKFCFYLVVLTLFLILLVTMTNIIKTPSLNRDWSEDSKILPNITFEGDIIKIKNIRDWRYDEKSIISKNYYDDFFDLTKINNIYLLFNPFGKWEGIGHSFFLFEFEDGKTISVSVEARREKDEDFNSLKGLFNKYELWYAFGSSADFILRRAIHYEDHELNMYPLLISKEAGKSLFLDLAQSAHELENEAKFYNTITSNCTNLLMDSANKVKKGSVPFHYSRIFTGFADDYIYKLGFIPNDKSFEEINKRYRVDLKIIEENSYFEDYSNDDFWKYFKKNIFDNL